MNCGIGSRLRLSAHKGSWNGWLISESSAKGKQLNAVFLPPSVCKSVLHRACELTLPGGFCDSCAPDIIMQRLTRIITASDPALRNQSLDAACAPLSRDELLAECAALD